MSTAGSLAAPGTAAPVASRPIVPQAILGMLLFLFTEAMLFAALLAAFFVLRVQQPIWPPPGQPRLPVGVTTINTLVLLGSGFAMIRSRGALHSGAAAAARWLGVTAALGLVFLIVQGFEWSRLLGFGFSTHANVFGATFYALVGVHAAHVAAAMIYLLVTWRRAAAGRFAEGNAEGLEACRMFWLFVVGVWPVLYLLLYQPWTGWGG